MAFITPAIRVLPASHHHLSLTPLRPTLLTPSHTHPSRLPTPTPTPTKMEFEISEGQTFSLNPAVIVLALAGWIIPSSLPAGIPLTEGSGLTQAFFARITENLAQFPKGPAGDDPIWTLMTLWHVGLFACLIFGTIGWNGRKTNAFDY